MEIVESVFSVSLTPSPSLPVIIVSIDEQSESQYVNEISSKNSSIDYTEGC